MGNLLLNEAVKRLQKYHSGLGSSTAISRISGDSAGSNTDAEDSELENFDNDRREFMSALYSRSGNAMSSSDISAKIYDAVINKNNPQFKNIKFIQGGSATEPTDLPAENTYSIPSDTDPVGLVPTIVQVIGHDNTFPASPINSSVHSPTLDKPSLSVVGLRNQDFSSKLADTNAASLMLNYMPGVELSRCVPYIRMYQVLPSPSVTPTGKITGMNVLKFLGVHDVSPGSVADALANKGIVNALSNNPSTFPKMNDNPGLTGIEAFIMPQTLINSNASTGELGVTLTEKYAPFVTLKQVTILEKHMQSGGNYTNNEVNAQIHLHDRARLSELRDILEVGRWSQVTWAFEIGWAHPGGNEYGNMLNNGIQTFLGRTQDSGFSLNPNGGVDIDVKFRALSNDAAFSSWAWEGLATTSYKIKTYVNRLIDQENRRQGNQRIEQLIMDRQSEPIPSAIDKIISFEARSILSGADADKWQEFGESITGDSQSVWDHIYYHTRNCSNVSSIYEAKKDVLDNQIDPFLPSKPIKFYRYENRKVFPTDEWVSFGKVVLMTLGEPVAMSNIVEDVQIHFGQVGLKSGAAAQLAIEQLPIKIQTVKDLFEEDLASPRRSLAFISRLIGKVFESPSYELYGGGGIVITTPEESAAEATGEPADPDKPLPGSRIPSDQRRDDKFGNIGDSFAMPNIRVKQEQGYSIQDGKAITVLKFIFFDENAGPNQIEKEMSSMNPGETLTLPGLSVPAGETLPADEDRRRERWSASSGIAATFVNGRLKMEPKMNIREWKNMISTYIPTIRYGTQGSTITNVSTNPNRSAEVERVFAYDVSRAINEGNSGQGASGRSVDLPPALLRASTVSVQCMGNPFVRYGQEFFIDFGTNTSLDTIYRATSITHTLTQGQYNTNIEFTATATGGILLTVMDGEAIIERAVAAATQIPFTNGD
jgi:hypothetical protein